MGKLCEVKRIRDQAYTYLKEAVDEIRRTGQYVFRRNKERYIGYISMHLRHAKSRQARKAKEKTQQVSVKFPGVAKKLPAYYN